MTGKPLAFAMSVSCCCELFSQSLVRLFDLLLVVALVELAAPDALGQPQLKAAPESLLSPSAGSHGLRPAFHAFWSPQPLGGISCRRSLVPFRLDLSGSVR